MNLAQKYKHFIITQYSSRKSIHDKKKKTHQKTRKFFQELCFHAERFLKNKNKNSHSLIIYLH